MNNIREAKYRVPNGSYWPEELGIYGLKGVRSLHVGHCIKNYSKGIDGFVWEETSNREKPNWSSGWTLAHVHQDMEAICFVDGAYIFSAPGVLDDVFIHEYCHILQPRFDENKDAHNTEWEKLMKMYGLRIVPWAEYIYR